MPTTGSVWRRRALLMAAVGIAIAIPLTIVVRSSEKEEATGLDVARELPLNPRVTADDLDIKYQVPEGWKQRDSKDALRFSSADDSVQVGLSAPGPANESEKILESALDQLRLTYDRVEVAPGSGRKIGGLRANGAVVGARNPKGDVDLRILVAVAAGRKRTYLVEVFTAAQAPGRPVAEAQRLLGSLRLNG